MGAVLQARLCVFGTVHSCNVLLHAAYCVGQVGLLHLSAMFLVWLHLVGLRSACKLAYVLVSGKSDTGRGMNWTVLLTHMKDVVMPLLVILAVVSVLAAPSLGSANMVSVMPFTFYQMLKVEMNCFRFCSSSSRLLQKWLSMILHVPCKTTA